MLGALAARGVSQAAIGTVDMAWDDCTGPIDKTTSVAAPYSLYITVVGHDEPQKAYDVRIVYGNGFQQVPDAWRFDDAGCLANQLTQDFSSNACPTFAQGAAGAMQIKFIRFSQPQDPYVQTLMQVLFANVYAPVDTVNPATRYLLERIVFDLSSAVAGAGSPPATCGGFDQPMCFKLSYGAFLDLQGNEIPFNLARPNLAVSFNEESPCPWVVAAKATTWGAIKSQYRN
jgi:hypothetical protein